MKIFAIILIVLITIFTRFYKLGEVPLSLDWDEVSNSYNAHSILKTGKDEYGTTLPLTNKSFDDYKPPLYMYLNVLSVKIFGLNSFAARLPSALAGAVSVLVLFFLTKELLKNEKIAYIATFFFSTSPWHIHFSRVGFESNLGLMFTLLTPLFFLKSLKNRNYLILLAICASSSMYAYHSQRIIVPLLLLTLFLIYRRKLFTIPKRNILVSAVAFVILISPLLFLVPKKALIGRLSAASASEKQEIFSKSKLLKEQDSQSKVSKFLHNTKAVTSTKYLENYLTYFDINFLFKTGDDNFRHHTQNMGMLFLFQMPLVFLGLYLFIKYPTKEKFFLIMWILIVPLAAIPANPNPHANRALPLIVPYTIVSAFALLSLSKNIKLCIFFVIVMTISFINYLHNYYSHYSVEKASEWQYGYLEAALASVPYSGSFDKIKINKNLEQGYIYWLFATKYDPKKFQKFGNRYNFENYYFDIEERPQNSKELYIANAERYPGDFKILKTIYYPDGKEAIKIGHKNDK